MDGGQRDSITVVGKRAAWPIRYMAHAGDAIYQGLDKGTTVVGAGLFGLHEAAGNRVAETLAAPFRYAADFYKDPGGTWDRTWDGIVDTAKYVNEKGPYGIGRDMGESTRQWWEETVETFKRDGMAMGAYRLGSGSGELVGDALVGWGVNGARSAIARNVAEQATYQASRSAARAAVEAADAAESSVPQVTANRLAGNAFRDEIAAALRAEGRGVQTEVYKKTPFGARYMYIEVSDVPGGTVLGGIETKLGNSRYTPSQRAKDMFLKISENYPVNVVREPR